MNINDNIKDLKNLEDLIDFSNLDKNHEVISNKNKKAIGKFEIETPKNISIDEFVCLRSKMYSFLYGDDKKNKLKGISKSQSEHNKFGECYNCLFGRHYHKECDNYLIRPINHEMYLQEVIKSTLFILPDKRCCVNETEKIPWM